MPSFDFSKKEMPNPLNLNSNFFSFISTITLIYVAYTIQASPTEQTNLVFFFFLFTIALIYVVYTISGNSPKQTNLVFYVHDYFTGHDTSAITVAGKSGPNSNVLHFGTIVAVDDPVTVGPSIESKQIGRAQGMYINSALDGRALHLVFSVFFTDGEYKGSSLEIQGADLFSLKEREFGIVSGTGYFRFVKGYGIMETEFMDIPNLRAILKLNVTVKHY